MYYHTTIVPTTNLLLLYRATTIMSGGKRSTKGSKKKKEKDGSGVTEAATKKPAKKSTSRTKSKKNEQREVPEEAAVDTMDAPELLQKNRKLAKHNAQLAETLKNEREEHKSEKIKSHYKRRCDITDPCHGKLKELSNAVYPKEKFLQKGDKNLVPDDADCLGMIFVGMCAKECPLNTTDMSVRLQWYNTYFPRLNFLMHQHQYRGTVKLEQVLQGKSMV